MKEIPVERADDSNSHLQMELSFDICPVEQIYTPNSWWDSLGSTHDLYWEDEQPTQQKNSCDIVDQECISFGGLASHLNEYASFPLIFDSAHQQSASVGEQIFIASQHQPSAPQQYVCVGEQVLNATKTYISETSVGEQVLNATKKTAPQHDEATHWVEKYWVQRAGNKFWYYRYMWMESRKIHRAYIGSVRSRSAQSKVELVREAIASGLSPSEIKQLINGEYD